MKVRCSSLSATALAFLVAVSSALALKITHVHEVNGLKATPVPQAATWRCKVTPPVNGEIYAGFDFLDTLYGYVESENGVAVYATSEYVFKSHPGEWQ